MKVLHVVNLNIGNEYVNLLYDGLKGVLDKVTFSVDAFYAEEDYDVVHFHWPEALTNWKEITRKDLERIEQLIDTKIDQGIKLVYTKHNDLPHHIVCKELYFELYALIERKAHLIIELNDEANFQIDQGVISISHGLYPHTEPLITKDVARAKLTFEKSAFLIFVFGTIRTYKEQKEIINFFEKCNVENKVIVIPGWKKAAKPSLVKSFIQRLIVEYRNQRFVKQDNVFTGLGFLNKKEVENYFIASDLIFLPRVKEKNSGVLIYAYSLGRPVVGFETGNIGKILRGTKNYILKDNSTEAYTSFFNNLKIEELEELGKSNYSYALQNWSWSKVVDKHVAAYRLLIAR